MTSIVIPYRFSRWNDTELRYCLRSIETYLKGYGDIFIIGDKPDWVKNVIHIPAEDDHRSVFKERNIYEKILLACKDERVSDEFLVVDDDHFLLTEYDAATFPYYYDEWPKRRNDMYQLTVDNTLKLHPNLCNSNIHCPIRINRRDFPRVVCNYNWEVKGGWLFRSIWAWGNQHNQYPDLKLRTIETVSEYRRLIAGRKWFSTDDGARCTALENLLKELYPKPSRYERSTP